MAILDIEEKEELSVSQAFWSSLMELPDGERFPTGAGCKQHRARSSPLCA